MSCIGRTSSAVDRAIRDEGSSSFVVRILLPAPIPVPVPVPAPTPVPVPVPALLTGERGEDVDAQRCCERTGKSSLSSPCAEYCCCCSSEGRGCALLSRDFCCCCTCFSAEPLRRSSENIDRSAMVDLVGRSVGRSVSYWSIYISSCRVASPSCNEKRAHRVHARRILNTHTRADNQADDRLPRGRRLTQHPRWRPARRLLPPPLWPPPPESWWSNSATTTAGSDGSSRAPTPF